MSADRLKNTGSKDDKGLCAKCGTCNTVCPTYKATGNEIFSPRGKQHLRSKVEKDAVSGHYADIFSRCLLCGACLDACPRGLDTPELVIRVRSELPRLSGLSFLKYVSRKALVHPALLANLSRIGTAANTLLGEWLPQDSGLRLRLQGFARQAFKLPQTGYIEKLKTEPPYGEKQQPGSPAEEMNFFTGCLANHLQPEIAESTQQLLIKSTGRKGCVPLEQTCCGMAALAAGRIGEAQELAKKNIAAFEENDYPILASCSSCYYQLKSYKEMFAGHQEWRQRAERFAERVEEFSTYFLQKLSLSRNLLQTAAGGPDKSVFYHDPCHLRFKLHITEEPRKLIRLLPGVSLEELPNGSQCCGHGGLFQVAHPDLAQRVQAKLMGNFAPLPGQTVLTACSGCLLQWQHGLASNDGGARAEHLAVFIGRLLQ
ncbi:MAG: (Fe-S)-binding protein [Desulfobulbales bacterium]|nr:(Fe-S)-binding protein [Desulfobulbales bacterium]